MTIDERTVPIVFAPEAGPRWVAITGGEFTMGSEDFYAEEGPQRVETVGDFVLSAAPITNRQFAAFVAATGYVTVAEKPAPFVEAPEPGSLVFTPTNGPVDLLDWRQWWAWVPGAYWRHPRSEGAGPSAEDLPDHPVVHVAYEDALAYAKWVGGRLPTEKELEYAACAGHRPAPYAWGSERDPGGEVVANTFRGSFPYRNIGAKGWIGTSPVGTFPANDFGLVDTIGNVWEWTSTPFNSRPHAAETTEGSSATDKPQTTCQCSPNSTQVASPTIPSGRSSAPTSQELDEPAPGDGAMTLKGGSHLCAPEYCLRYRPAAKSPQTKDSATTHIGFRIAKDA